MITLLAVLSLILAVTCFVLFIVGILQEHQGVLALSLAGTVLAGFMVLPAWDRYVCTTKWSDFENRYGLIEGCMVKQDDKWFPSDRVRSIE